MNNVNDPQGKPDPRFANCIFCWGMDTCKEGVDKRGRPFFSCRACGTKAFIHSESGIVGPALMRAFIEAAGARRLQYWLATHNQAQVLSGMAILVKDAAKAVVDYVQQEGQKDMIESVKVQ